jgi:hypothetical protein
MFLFHKTMSMFWQVTTIKWMWINKCRFPEIWQKYRFSWMFSGAVARRGTPHEHVADYCGSIITSFANR